MNRYEFSRSIGRFGNWGFWRSGRASGFHSGDEPIASGTCRSNEHYHIDGASRGMKVRQPKRKMLLPRILLKWSSAWRGRRIWDSIQLEHVEPEKLTSPLAVNWSRWGIARWSPRFLAPTFSVFLPGTAGCCRSLAGISASMFTVPTRTTPDTSTSPNFAHEHWLGPVTAAGEARRTWGKRINNLVASPNWPLQFWWRRFTVIIWTVCMRWRVSSPLPTLAYQIAVPPVRIFH